MRILPLIAASIVGAKNPEAGGAFAQGVLGAQQFNQRNQFAQQRLELDRQLTEARLREAEARQQEIEDRRRGRVAQLTSQAQIDQAARQQEFVEIVQRRVDGATSASEANEIIRQAERAGEPLGVTPRHLRARVFIPSGKFAEKELETLRSTIDEAVEFARSTGLSGDEARDLAVPFRGETRPLGELIERAERLVDLETPSGVVRPTFREAFPSTFRNPQGALVDLADQRVPVDNTGEVDVKDALDAIKDATPEPLKSDPALTRAERQDQIDLARQRLQFEITKPRGQQALGRLRRSLTQLGVVASNEDWEFEVAQARQASQPEEFTIERTDRILATVDALLENAGDDGSNLPVGLRSLAAFIPSSEARDFRAQVDRLKANIAFSELQEMRDASKTGGALGQVSERELTLLESARGALDIGQSPEAFKRNLEEIRASLQRWRDAKLAHALDTLDIEGTSGSFQVGGFTVSPVP